MGKSKQGVLEDYRDEKIRSIYLRSPNNFQSFGRLCFDAAIDLLPVLFNQWMRTDRYKKAKEYKQNHKDYPDMENFDLWGESKLYTYWKENVLTKEDIKG